MQKNQPVHYFNIIVFFWIIVHKSAYAADPSGGMLMIIILGVIATLAIMWLIAICIFLKECRNYKKGQKIITALALLSPIIYLIIDYAASCISG
ncbi:hypothetical protein [Formivibrio citricus]|uniref:hypothetical protein n=1 Tax=Formivibrio citricus TaxID=83765 RepID=UPI00116058BD|nr:hypothetical protein [Formivibrio citricus]